MNLPKNLIQKWKHRFNTKQLDRQKRQCFDKTISTVQQLLDMVNSDIERAEILDYAVNVIGRELAYSVAAELLHFGTTPEEREFYIPPESAKRIANENCSLSGVNIISDTYDLDKLRKAVPQVYLNGFHQELSNYTGTYYPEINLVVVENGRHHLSAAAVKNIGSAKLNIYSLKPAFPRMKTDGAYWYTDDVAPLPVYDYRVAVLYELARIKDSFLPDNVYDLTSREFLIPEESSKPNAYRDALLRIQWLELEIGIKNFQIALLKKERSPEKLQKDITSLEEQNRNLKNLIETYMKLD